jgi:hypothetical protein
MKFMKLGLLAAGAMALPAAANSADDIINTGLLTLQDAPSSWTEAFAAGEGSIFFNYRWEEVDSSAVADVDNAHGSTLRTVVDYRTATYEGFSGYVQFENTSVIGESDRYSTANRPTIADPKGSDLNQAYVDMALGGGTLRVGRQEVVLDNARFVGNVGWRQNHQSFDALAWVGGADLPFGIVYGYVDNINTITAGALRTKSHILNISKDLDGVGKASVYGYALDVLAVPGLSTMTIGARIDGKMDLSDDMKMAYLLEYATQSDYADNTSMDADYYHVKLGADLGSFKVAVGQESLGSDNGLVGFSTPLATKHAFNGWADKFLNTPAAGLEDLYFSAGTMVSGVNLSAVLHDFSSEFGSTDYGTELDFVAKYKANEYLTYGLKYADFSADSSGGMDDINKMWFWVTWAP